MAEKSYKTIRTFRGNGSQTTFNFNFRFLRKTFVTVKVDNTDKVYGVDYTVTNTEEVVFFTAPPAGSVIIIKRVTQTAPMVSWADGSVLLAKDLGLQGTQLFHIQEEVSDAVQTDAAENAEVAQAAADRASASQVAAGTSEVNAKTAETSAKTSESNSKVSETNAKVSETNAKTSETNAKDSADKAKVSETNARASELDAESAEQRVITMEATIKALSDKVENLVNNKTIYVPTQTVGVPFFWPTTAARPDGTLVCDGQAFSVSAYPELAKVYPTGVLPDMRGVVPRGLDRGRGLDPDGAARTAGSYQGDTYQSHGHETWINAAGQPIGGEGQSGRLTTVWRLLATVDTAQGRAGLTSNTGFTETRGKNIAGDWLVYATTLKYDLTVGGGNAVSLGGHPASTYFRQGDTKVATVVQRVAEGVNPGTAVANNQYINRVLDTITVDTIGITLKDNIVTLPAGSYEITASSQFYAVGVGMLQLAVDASSLAQTTFFTSGTTQTCVVNPVLSGFYSSGQPIKIQMFYKLTNESYVGHTENLGIRPRVGMTYTTPSYVHIRQI